MLVPARRMKQGPGPRGVTGTGDGEDLVEASQTAHANFMVGFRRQDIQHQDQLLSE